MVLDVENYYIWSLHAPVINMYGKPLLVTLSICLLFRFFLLKYKHTTSKAILLVDSPKR